MYQGRPWSIPRALALRLLDEMESKGGLSDAYLDHRIDARGRRSWDDSGGEEARRAFDDVVLPDEDWGSNPGWLIFESQVPAAGGWRKIMLLNRDTDQVTFRSTTTDPAYRPRKIISPDMEWVLDNSMQDASIRETRLFHERLRSWKGP